MDNIEKINNPNKEIKDNFLKMKFDESKKYAIKFNTDSIPVDWNQWIQLDIKKIPSLYCMHGYFSLDSFGFVVIESFDEDFDIELGGTNYKFDKGRKYIPIFYGVHSARIKIKENLKIYVGPGYNKDFNNLENPIDLKNPDMSDKFLNGDSRGGNPLWYFLYQFPIIYENLNLNKSHDLYYKDCSLVFTNGMYGYGHFQSNSIPIENFYFDYINNANGSEDTISFIDNFVQHDIIKI